LPETAEAVNVPCRIALGQNAIVRSEKKWENKEVFAIGVYRESRAMKQSWMCLAVMCGLLGVLALGRAGEAPPFKMTEEETKLLELTNQERKKKELSPLKPSSLLFKLARDHSANMGKQAKMDHILDGKKLDDRVKEAKYQYALVGENIAAGDAQVGLPEVMGAWMESKLHRGNILGPEFTEIGLGLARGKDGQIYYTQVFAKPRAKQ
jgi:uncharacterized protein YkwD